VVLSAESLEDLEAASEQLAEELSSHLEADFTEEQVKILGPAPCLIERIRGKFRHHLIIKNLAGDLGRTAITSFLRTHRSTAAVQIAIDVDAVDLI
jgi:primosomal protein N' (replication factor Y)